MLPQQITGAVVGRDVELDVLAHLRDQAVRGAGAVVAIEGVPGIGKSALLDALAESAAATGFTTLTGEAEELDSRIPFSALASCLEMGTRAGAPEWAELGELLRLRRPGDGGQSADIDFAVGQATVALVEELTATRPTLIALDDAQWADERSLRALLQVAALAPQLPLVLAVAHRPGHEPALEAFLGALARRRHVSLRLERLADASLTSFVEDRLGAAPGPNLLEQLRAAGGNPFFLTMIIEALGQAGGLATVNGSVDVENVVAVPTLPVTVLQRLRFCSPATLEVLALASVLGTTFTAADLSTARGTAVTDVLPALREGLANGIVQERGDVLAFRHDLIRESLYLDMPASVRDELHLELATSFAKAGAPPLVVAEHLLRGAMRPGRGIIDMLHHTAVDVIPVAASVAVELLERAVALDPTTHDRVDADLAVALLRADRADDGEALCRAAISQGLAPSVDADLAVALVNSLASRGRPQDAIDEARRALDAGAAPRHGARLEAITAVMHTFSGDFESAVAAAQRALTLSAASADRVAESSALSTLSLTSRLAGRFGESLELAERSVAVADSHPGFDMQMMVPHAIAAVVLLDLDRIDDALRVSRRGLAAAEAASAPRSMGSYHVIQTRLLFHRGDWDAAEQESDAVYELTGGEPAPWTPIVSLVRALISLHRNDVDAARSWGARAENELAATGSQFQIGFTLPARAVLLEAEGRSVDAFTMLRESWELCAAFDLQAELAWMARDTVRIAMQLGPDQLALVHAVPERMAALVEANPGIPDVTATERLCHGLVHGDLEALTAAVEASRASPRPLAHAELCEVVAGQIAAADRRDAALELLEESFGIYQELELARDISRTEAAFRNLGVTRGRRGTRRRPKTGWDALTNSEVTVVKLVAEQLSNPEIARRLFVSRRTVQTHVSHALAKLDVSSRRDLAQVAARHL